MLFGRFRQGTRKKTTSEKLTIAQDIYLEKLQNECGAKIIDLSDDEVTLELWGLRVTANGHEDLFVTYEVLAQEVYGCQFQHSVVVIDVGMNIGVASLYFAQKDFVKRVYGFEPVNETFQLLQRNLIANPSLSTKIIAKPFGLSNERKKDHFQFNSSYKGSVGTVGYNAAKIAQIEELSITEVHLLKASEEVKAIIKDNPGLPILIKLDCEGAELEILQDLKKESLINSISYVLGEWHNNNLDKIIPLLDGFRVFYRRESFTTGMFYAFK